MLIYENKCISFVLYLIAFITFVFVVGWFRFANTRKMNIFYLLNKNIYWCLPLFKLSPISILSDHTRKKKLQWKRNRFPVLYTIKNKMAFSHTRRNQPNRWRMYLHKHKQKNKLVEIECRRPSRKYINPYLN